MPPQPPVQTSSSLLGAFSASGAGLLRVNGRADMSLSSQLQEFAEGLIPSPEALVIDLSRSTGMDSTFMGMIAAIACARKKRADGPVVLIGVNAQLRQTITGIGLAKVVVLHEEAPPELDTILKLSPQPLSMEPVPRGDVPCQTILESHETLADLAEGKRREELELVADLCRKKLMRAAKKAEDAND